VVTEALRLFAAGSPPQRLADLGCGTGCIGVSLLAQWNEAQGWFVDKSPEALGCAKENASSLGARAIFVESSVEDWRPSEPFDLVVMNPPYIPIGDPRVQPSVHQYEPHTALYAGADGLGAWRSWTQALSQYVLKSNGVLVGEFGQGQYQELIRLLRAAHIDVVSVARDLSGYERVVVGVKRG
jgi:release factor glutamine methyltransferase